MYFLDESKSLIKVALFLYSSIFFTTSIGSITAYVMGIYVRLVSMSKFLELKKIRKLSSQNCVHVKGVEDKNSSEVIGILTTIYQQLIDICDDVNLVYGFQTMLGFGLIFFYTLFTNLTAYTDFWNDGRLSPVTINAISFSVYFNISIASVLFTCSLLDSEVISKFAHKNSLSLTNGSLTDKKHRKAFLWHDEGDERSLNTINTSVVHLANKNTRPQDNLRPF